MRAPDLQGVAGRAWNLEMIKRAAGRPHSGLAEWLIHAPASHPIWPWHLMCLIHLREVRGLASASKNYPEAEFEVILFAIDPERCAQPDPDAPPLEGRAFPLLEPPDVVEQFHGVSDHDACRIVEAAARACVQGYLVPDSDYRSAWKTAIAGTVQHFASGAHVES